MRATNAMNRFHPFLHLPLLFILIQPIGGSILTGNQQLSQKWREMADPEPMASEMKFMRGLFDQFNKGDREMGRHRSSMATGYAPTVKEGKICPENDGPKEKKRKEKAKEEGKFGMAFRLNELKPAERLVRAELHLFFPNSLRHGNSSEFLPKKYGKLNGKGYHNKYPPKHIELFHRINCAKDERKILRRMEKDGREEGNSQMGWATFDATKLVEGILARREESSELFIQVKKHGQFLSSTQLHRLAHLHRPFLVIYTDLEDEGKKPTEEGGKRAKREAQKFTNYGNADEIRRHMEEARKTAEYYSYGMAKGGKNNNQHKEDGGGIPMPTEQDCLWRASLWRPVCGGRSVAGRSVAGRSVAGQSVAGRSVAAGLWPESSNLDL